MEFVDRESSVKAKHLNESLFKGRQLTVMPKRKNKPGMGRGGYGGGGGRGGGNPMAMMMQLMRGMSRGMYRGGGRGRGGPGGFRGRGRGAGGPAEGGQQPSAPQGGAGEGSK